MAASNAAPITAMLEVTVPDEWDDADGDMWEEGPKASVVAVEDLEPKGERKNVLGGSSSRNGPGN